MSEILFGTAYYPEYLSEDRIEKDIQLMRAAGMNTVRLAESTWSTMEPMEGRFDFTILDRALEEAEKAGMHVVIGTPTYAIPAWLAAKSPDVMVTTKEGQADYGHRQLMNIKSPTFLKYAERIIRRLLMHTADRECVIGFQIDNETKHYGIADEQTQKLFVEHLKRKFGTCENLNRAFTLNYWSNSIAEWEDFPDMRGCTNGGLAAEYARFQRKLVTQYLDWQAKIVSEYRREDQFITHNFDFEWKKFGADIAQDGYSYGIQPDVDHADAAEAVTTAGVDIYHPTQDELTGAEIAFCGDEIRCLKQQSYLVLETQAQAFKYWTPYPGQLRLHAYSHLASGATGLMYWNYHSIHSGYETYWKGLLSHDMESNPTYEEACQIGKEWKQLGEQLVLTKKKNKIAMIVDNSSLTALQWFPIDRDLSYNDVVRYLYDTLFEMNMECDILHADLLPDLSGYRMVVTPALYSVSEKTVQQLKEFVRQGGVLVSTFKSFVADENLRVFDDRLPHGMTDCFGMSYQQYTEPGRARLWGTRVKYFAELLSTKEAESLGNYEHPYWKSYSAVTRNQFGQGTAYYIGCFSDRQMLRVVYRKAAKDAGILEKIPELSWPVIVRSGRNAQGNQLHYFLHYSENHSLVPCPYREAVDVQSGCCYHEGDMIPLSDWGVVILKEAEEKNDSESNLTGI